MIEVLSNEVTSEMLALLVDEVPVQIRRTAVLTSQLPGKILTDNPHAPSWMAIWEAGDGTVYWNGVVVPETVTAVARALQQEGEVLFPFWTADNPIVACLPLQPDFKGAALDFMARDPNVDLDAIINALPAGLSIQPANLALFEQTHWYADNIRLLGSAENYLATTRAFYLLRGDEILSEASAGPLVDGVRELGILTQEAHRGLGYATLTAAYLVREMEKEGERPFWNCSSTNHPSAAVARKLGFHNEKLFNFAWYKPLNQGDSPD
ncbi:MAG: GNAT family N-acetyltransferase [Chloroflexota bacterium]